ncbi:hypothetical protein [Pseudoalteromonas sp. APC 3218]|uniref:hypothetical protein n=1 Tax=Pseudoalteromonas sp. APC 3218 TaxID=3035180 RepID=UPI0025B5C489|nr:hypothetical protein [Pseudoalteromonas sp. APC 3218]MDN3404203.1 hypothetical protein [Pseudoalteromonas sp. APC 3218]
MPTSYEHQLDILLERFKFHFTKSEIKKVLETTSQSKDGFKEDILAVIANNRELQIKIDELGLLALQLDTRQIEVYNISEDVTQLALGSLFSAVNLTNKILIKDAFPFPIEEKTKLDSLKTGKVYPILSDTVTMGGNDYNRLVVSTIIVKEVEEPVPKTHLSKEGQEYQDDNAIYMMKRKIRTQLFHVVYWCEALSKLILSVDRNVLSLSITQDQLFLLKQFLMSNGVDSVNAVNVFGAIEPLYNSDDGYITKIGHVTTDGNPVRIPLKSKQKCLKEDHYHQAGEGAGHVHAKFAVSKKWEFKVANTQRTVDIEVGLNGQPKMLDTAQPLSDFTIIKSKRLEDMNFAIDKVLTHIPNA